MEAPGVSNTEEWSFTGLDPSTTPAADYADAITGDFYYNSTTGQFKTVNTGGAPLGTWASGGSLGNGPARMNQGLGNAGTQTAAIAAGGGHPTKVDYTELYNGSSWSEVNELNTARASGGLGGTTSSALYAEGGSNPAPAGVDLVESWDGTNWTEVAETPTAGGNNVIIGNASAALSVGGVPTPTNADVQSWNGSTWTEIANLNSGRYGGAGTGNTTDAIFFCGSPEPAGVTKNESWDGSSWTEVGDLNTSKVYTAGSGTTTSALNFGGQSSPGQIALCEFWNGSSWTEVADLSTAGNALGGAGASASSSLAFGGYTRLASTEEFTADDFQIKTVTQS